MSILRKLKQQRVSHYFAFLGFIAFTFMAIASAYFFKKHSIRQLMDLEESKAHQISRLIMQATSHDAYGLIENSHTFDRYRLINDSRAEKIHSLVEAYSKGITNIIRVEVFDLNGKTVFATDNLQTGEQEDSVEELREVYRTQKATTEISFRQEFKSWKGEMKDIFVLSTFMPLIVGEALGPGKMVGAFEVYTDITVLMNRIEQISQQILLLSLFVFSIMYGVVWYILNLAEDRATSQEKKHQEVLRKNEDRLHQTFKLATLGQMSSSISHEMNNPLMVIRGNAEVIRDQIVQKQLNEEKILSSTEKILKHVSRIASIVEKMATMGRRKNVEELHEHNLKVLVQNAIDVCQSRISQKNISIRFTGFDEELYLQCRSFSMVQVFINLINNSLDALETTPDPWIEFTLKKSENYIQILVQDNGSGLTPEAKERAFEPFFTTRDVGKGTGLGLSVSESIVREAGGILFIDNSSPYTCFVIQFNKSANIRIGESNVAS